MLDRLELAGQSMIVRMAQLETITNNLANLSTKGYKRNNIFTRAVTQKLAAANGLKGNAERQMPDAVQGNDLSQGELVGTQRPLDVALSGQGVFVLETPNGEAYTRDGRFSLNEEGILSSMDGYPVMGEGGTIEINVNQLSETQVLISEQGEIIVDGNVIDKLLVLGPGNPNDLVKVGGNLFKLANPGQSMAPLESATVKQGFLENANVDPIKEMVSLMEILQHFKIDEKVVRTQEDILDRAANQIGRMS